ncbi:MAG: hypothetical protein RI891_586 [Gemmatimonadota bacterium]
MSKAGKMRFSASERSSLISQLPVPLNSSKITSSIRDPVSTSAVAMIVSEPPPCCGAMLRAEPKKAFGLAIAEVSRPPESVRPVPRSAVLKARAMRVSESSTMITSCPCSTSRRERSMTISTTSTCRLAGWSKLEATTSPTPHEIASLTSSGRSSTRRMRRVACG